MKHIPLLGYTDRLSARAGESIGFKISCRTGEPVTARLYRSVSADPNPRGPGIIEEDAQVYFDPMTISAADQPFYPGSYGCTEQRFWLEPQQELCCSAIIYPTLHKAQSQCVLACGQVALSIAGDGCVTFTVAGNSIATNVPLILRRWYKVVGKVSHDGQLSIEQQPLEKLAGECVRAQQTVAVNWPQEGVVSVAASVTDAGPDDFYNGKVEAPEIHIDGKILAGWDLARETSACQVPGLRGERLELFNFPARGMTSSAWDGSEMCWRHCPEHYAAIHFHEDDIYDFGWETDFQFEIPTGMPSGIYVMRISSAGYEDALPIYICPTLGNPGAKLLVLISTFTYSIYGNHARPDYESAWQERIQDWRGYPYNPAEYPEYGLSTYNNHRDGSGICHASHRRPLFNLRPGYITFGAAECSGLRHFQADSHLISWLHAKGIDYEVITDAELHRDGVAVLEAYPAVTTASHPEYHTREMLDALLDYRDQGGALHYLGGNGFYWRIALHRENDSLLEIRRAEDGIRAWAAEPGEYYNAFDGGYGGLWRRNGRTPQRLVGIGFTAQGEFVGGPYKRTCTDPCFDWVFEGISDQVFGDFGYSGNGAAGFELDNVGNDHHVPENITVLAQSVNAATDFMLVPEEQLTHLTNLSGAPAEDALRADMVYFEVPGGGRVFSTGSITFCGSLPWNNYENAVSRLLENVLRRHMQR